MDLGTYIAPVAVPAAFLWIEMSIFVLVVSKGCKKICITPGSR